MSESEREKRRLAIINLTIERPNEFRVSELGRWSGLSSTAIRNLVKSLELEIKKGWTGKSPIRDRRIEEDLEDYFTCGELKKDSVRKQIDIALSLQEETILN